MRAMAQDIWAPCPLPPVLADGAVHVWRADLTEVAQELEELLCDEERVRAARIVNPCNGELWGRSRGLLRTLLGRYLHRDPRSLRFTSDERGKPALAREPDESPDPLQLSFNLSHSGHLALYAFSASGAVGVDVQLARHPIDEVAIAARALGAAEARRLQALAPEIRRLEFLRAWTRHEAKLKCLGVGIAGAGDAIAARGLWVAGLDAGLDAAAAVASEHPVLELRCWDWQP
jgi:4'-phosphopantetheinyl transferase